MNLPSKPMMGTIMMGIACLMSIMFTIANVSVHQALPRMLRIVSISTFGLGNAIGNALPATAHQSFKNSSVYGNPAQALNLRSPGDGLRTYYTWGFLKRCAGYGEPSGLQYCTTARLAYPLDPNAALIEDIPSVYAPGLTTILSDKISGMVPDKALGLTKMAGLSIMNSFLHFLMIIPLGICAALGKGPKWSAVGALGASGGTLFGLTVALGMWISAISNLRSRVNGKTLEAFNHVPLGIDVQIGNAIWLLFMIDLHVLAGTILFALNYVAVRRERSKALALQNGSEDFSEKGSY